MSIIAGTQTHEKYDHVELSQIVGKTVEAVVETTVEGAWGDEPCILIRFTDGTEHGFVLPTDDD